MELIGLTVVVGVILLFLWEQAKLPLARAPFREGQILRHTGSRYVRLKNPAEAGPDDLEVVGIKILKWGSGGEFQIWLRPIRSISSGLPAFVNRAGDILHLKPGRR